MLRLRFWVAVGSGLLLGAGCGGSQSTPRDEEDQSAADKVDENWSPDEESWAPGERDSRSDRRRVHMDDVRGSEGSGASDQDRGRAPSTSPDYEMTYNDCNALAEHYYRVIQHEQIGKIPEGLKAAQRSAAERSAEENAAKGRDEWLKQCGGLVGSAYSHEWLECGMKADTVDGFNDCVTGGGAQK